MSLKKYTEAALKTESKIDAVKTNENRLLSILEVIIGAGNLLDDIKKNIFYDRPIDNDKFDKSFNTLKSGFQGIETGMDQNSLSLQYHDIDPRVFHGIIGIATESTELLEALYYALTTGTLDTVNTSEEIGDINWYSAILLDALDQNWDKILDTNTEKLTARYNGSFSNNDANTRDLDTEREILES